MKQKCQKRWDCPSIGKLFGIIQCIQSIASNAWSCRVDMPLNASGDTIAKPRLNSQHSPSKIEISMQTADSVTVCSHIQKSSWGSLGDLQKCCPAPVIRFTGVLYCSRIVHSLDVMAFVSSAGRIEEVPVFWRFQFSGSPLPCRQSPCESLTVSPCVCMGRLVGEVSEICQSDARYTRQWLRAQASSPTESDARSKASANEATPASHSGCL